MRGALVVLVLAGLLIPARPVAAVEGCEPEPASMYAPAGWVCPPIYGEGIASTWQGPGVATNSCVYPWTDCDPIRITVIETGAWIEVRPVMWCMCYVGVTGPLGETQRIVDLPPDVVAALNLPGPGLHRVRVEPIPGAPLSPPFVLPDTAIEVSP